MEEVAAQRKRKNDEKALLVRYADDVRHLTHYSIPLGERRSSEEMTSGLLGPPGGENQRGN
jgi:hypothetical protein